MLTDRLKEFSIYLPYAGSFIIFLGIIRLMAYYSAFGVPIISYLEFSEILTSFLDILTEIGLLLLLGVMQGFTTANKKDAAQRTEHESQLMEEPNFFQRLRHYLAMNKWLISFGIAYSIIMTILHLVERNFHWTLYFYVLVMVLAV